MKAKILLAACCFMLLSAPLYAQIRVNGYVRDAQTGEALIGASIYNADQKNGAVANTYGYYSLQVPERKVVLEFSFVGYEVQRMELILSKDTTINVALQIMDKLSEVQVLGTRPELELTKMSSIKITSATIRTIPALLGEVDVMKAIQLLPGIQGGTEGSSGIYVRGGGPDQNLILLDGVPVYNAAHLFGFFSVFNNDAINSVEVIKGGFPARYGGRLSSVIDINMKEGNMQNWQAEGGVGIISSRLSVQGPLIKDKSSIIVSARRTYIDVLARPLIRMNTGGQVDGGYFFYDLNGKINYKFSDKDRIYLSAYAGRDKFYAKEDSEYNSGGGGTYFSKGEAGLNWGNFTSTFRWNHLFSNKLFLNSSLTYSNFSFRLFDQHESFEVINDQKQNEYAYAAAYNSGITDYAARFDFDYFLSSRHNIKFGANHIFHTFQPSAFNLESAFDEEVFDTLLANNVIGNETAIYIQDEINFNKKLSINAGLHFSTFHVNNTWYRSLQPRFSGRYLINDQLSIKASYASMAQFLHLLTNSGLGLPTDLWVPVTDKVKPQFSNQIAAGLAALLADKKYELTVEGYYKTMQNVIEYKEGSNFLELDSDWEGNITSGRGWAYGAEVLLRKNEGKFTGWLGYTLAWNYRQFDDLNFGRVFPFKYDRRHDVSIVVNYKPRKEFEWSATWVYGTGIALTIPIAKYKEVRRNQDFENSDSFYTDDIYQYSDRNAYRMPAYHRLDLGLTWYKVKDWGESSWTIAIYNAYNRQNPFFIDTRYSWEKERTTFYQVSLFQLIPSLTYNFKFTGYAKK